MYKDLKYMLDFLFIFMLIVSVVLFSIGFFVDLSETALHTVERIDFVVLGGYYGFFMHGFYKAKQKVDYLKHHWIMLALLLIPFIPIARLMKFVEMERMFAIGANTLWHFLDELGML